ncbi:hypothetical protein FHT00_000983 [Sphingomonas insulae]|uniref:Uncharacterized protein n=1 Tax=Sphingomonas insulae TaxID=424800 RepID=A0ABN1HSF7_9SPHN|nr:hypothetical protein [Sphingomonas insulae]NIJ29050.1 hypothetical protein [Sphingomonas insulae]
MTKIPSSIALMMLCATSSLGAAPPQGAVERSQHPGDALRARLGVVLPATDTMIIIHGVAQHHTRTEWSIVASRSKDGQWTVERAGEEGPGLLAIEPHPLSASKTILTPDKGKALDRLLGDRQAYLEKVSGGDLSIGGYASTMEIVTSGRTRRVDWTGRLVGKLGQIVDLVTSPG